MTFNPDEQKDAIARWISQHENEDRRLRGKRCGGIPAGEPCYGEPGYIDLRTWGWAPGSYTIKCKDPDHPVTRDDWSLGDKYCSRCRPCALRRHMAVARDEAPAREVARKQMLARAEQLVRETPATSKTLACLMADFAEKELDRFKAELNERLLGL